MRLDVGLKSRGSFPHLAEQNSQPAEGFQHSRAHSRSRNGAAVQDFTAAVSLTCAGVLLSQHHLPPAATVAAAPATACHLQAMVTLLCSPHRGFRVICEVLGFVHQIFLCQV